MKSFENSKTIEPFSGAGMSSPTIGNHFRDRVRLSPTPGTGTHFQVCVWCVTCSWKWHWSRARYICGFLGERDVVTRTWKCVAFPAIFRCGWRCHRHLETLLKVQVKFRTFLLYRVINSPNPRKNWDTTTRLLVCKKLLLPSPSPELFIHHQPHSSSSSG
jgi:hypothetical protein